MCFSRRTSAGVRGKLLDSQKIVSMTMLTYGQRHGNSNAYLRMSKARRREEGDEDTIGVEDVTSGKPVTATLHFLMKSLAARLKNLY